MILLENQFLYVFRLLILGQMYIYLLTLNAWCFGAGCCTSVIFYLYLLKSIAYINAKLFLNAVSLLK